MTPLDVVSNYLIHLECLRNIQTGLALLGVLESIYVMALVSYEQEDAPDPIWLQWFRRGAYAVTALALIWMTNFMTNRNWEPWPPSVVLTAGVVLMMASRIVSLRIHYRRVGGSPREKAEAAAAKRAKRLA